MATIPDEIVYATETGDAAAVQRWLADGGNPNLSLASGNSCGFFPGFRLLLIATSCDHTAIVSALLEHGADASYLFIYPAYDGSLDPRGRVTALSLAARRIDLVLARILLDHGAARSAVPDRALETPRLLRMFLMAGGDVSAPTMSGKIPEQFVRQRLDYYQTHRPPNYQAEAVTCAESLRILEGTRLAGSYKNYVLQEYKELLRLRSLLARKRASIGPATPEVVARLFGGWTDATRPARRHGRPLPPRTAGVPDPAFWLVMEYWRLGDWRHPV